MERPSKNAPNDGVGEGQRGDAADRREYAADIDRWPGESGGVTAAIVGATWEGVAGVAGDIIIASESSAVKGTEKEEKENERVGVATFLSRLASALLLPPSLAFTALEFAAETSSSKE